MPGTSATSKRLTRAGRDAPGALPLAPEAERAALRAPASGGWSFFDVAAIGALAVCLMLIAAILAVYLFAMGDVNVIQDYLGN